MTMSLNCSFVERMVGFDCPSMRHKFEKFSQDCIAVRRVACVKSGGLGREGEGTPARIPLFSAFRPLGNSNWRRKAKSCLGIFFKSV